jgi:hypothetical protein
MKVLICDSYLILNAASVLMAQISIAPHLLVRKHPIDNPVNPYTNEDKNVADS